MMSREAGGGGIAPVALAMVRMIGAALFFRLVGAKDAVRLTRGDHARLVGLSLLGIVVNQTLFLVGLRMSSPFAVAILGCTIPVLTAALAAVLGQERLKLRTALGLASAITGVMWLTGLGRVDWGALVVALNSLSYSAYIVLSRRTIQRLGATTVVRWIFTWGALVFAPVGLPVLVRDAAAWNATSLLFAGYIILVPTILAYTANAWALGRTSPTLVTVYIYLQPMVAALLAWVQLGQPVTSRMATAAVFIVLGVLVVASRRPVATKRAPS